MTQIDWPSSSIFEGPWQSPGFRLWHRFHEWQRRANAALRPLGLTQPQFSVLAVAAWLGRDTSDVSQQRMADFAALDRMLVSQIVRKLETKGLVSRSQSRTDARLSLVALTEEGARVLSEALQIVEASDKEFFEQADGDPSD